MKTQFFKCSFALFMLVSILFSCQQDQTPIGQPSTEQDVPFYLETVSQALAQMIGEEEVRILIRKNALRQFDNDYDILYKDIKDVKLSTGESFEERLLSFIPASSQPDALSAALAAIPKLQISVPVHCEDWETESFIPRVAIQPYGQDEASIQRIEAYDLEGRQSFLDAKVDPDFPVVVVGINERTDENGVLLAEYTPRPDKPAPARSKRNSGDPEILHWIQIPNLNGVEGWADGKPELHIIVVGGRGSGTSGTATVQEITKKVPAKPRRRDIQNGIDVDLWLFDWKTEPTTIYTVTTADEIKIQFVEIDDNGSSWKLPVSVGGGVKVIEPITKTEVTRNVTGGIEYSYKGKDDDCGDSIVDFNHPKPGPPFVNQYSTGTVNFKMG